MIFGINTTSDILKLFCVISRAIRRVNLRQFWSITSGIYDEYHVQIILLFVYTTTCKRFVIFTCGYFKLSWNTTALSQANCRNFSCSSIRAEIRAVDDNSISTLILSNWICEFHIFEPTGKLEPFIDFTKVSKISVKSLYLTCKLQCL